VAHFVPETLGAHAELRQIHFLAASDKDGLIPGALTLAAARDIAIVEDVELQVAGVAAQEIPQIPGAAMIEQFEALQFAQQLRAAFRLEVEVEFLRQRTQRFGSFFLLPVIKKRNKHRDKNDNKDDAKNVFESHDPAVPPRRLRQ